MGYNGDIGYESFLYPTERDMRSLIIWLVSKLPKHDEEEHVEERLGMEVMSYFVVTGLLIILLLPHPPIFESRPGGCEFTSYF